MGAADKTIRIILGIIIIVGGFYYKSWWGLVGLIPLLTAFISWCPLYAPFGISTCRKK
ncbi:YgaP family membrane protein [Saccharicrinis sp. 156]|uniref:YgaP family membrane protein n=1 Tax=Saccharicrinis sp. 156 TaxID=3417574 RepID=UPI003D336827